ncbi:hypothetical protein C1I63_04305 [Rathayibacter caricis DSM 15933]|uniref:Uncharacterized protein n=1 Tax=Rathayibacter caricis DSM 15933 TaxID=1328867 RepID=A0A2T4URI1_9MICO|nr:hypothetical protein [Rathayibacter caricis]PTL72140.1 hypothetical protein C1I63_04305 [Rathayibacter caricis DSM 15933]
MSSTETTPLPGALTPRHPRIRLGAIVWSLFAAAVAVGLLIVSGDQGLRAELVDAALTLSPGAIAAVVVAALGGLALLIGLERVLDRR